MSTYAYFPLTGNSSGITSINGDTTAAQIIAAGTGISVSTTAGTTTISSTGGGGGSVTSVSVVSANGLAGSVANPTTTPALTLSTTVMGLIKGNGTALSAATAGTDYVIPSGSITGTASNITATSNSTLTTLSALSLPTSQLTGTLSVANGGTGLNTLITYELLAAGTTATGVLQQIGIGTSGQVLTSNGAGALPSFQSTGAAANQTLSNLSSPTSINQNLLFSTDNSFAIGGPYPTAAHRPSTVWAATAVVAGNSGNTFIADGGIILGNNSGGGHVSWSMGGGELQLQINSTQYLFIETNTTLDYGTITVGTTVGSGSTAGFLTANYQTPANTQVHNTVALGCDQDLSSGFSVLAAGTLAIVSAGVVGFEQVTGTALTLGGSGLTPQHSLNTSTAAPAAGVGTFTNLPTGYTGNPTGYVQITINGGTHVIPYW